MHFFIDFILSVRMIEGFQQEVLCRYGNEPWKNLYFNYRLRLEHNAKADGNCGLYEKKNEFLESKLNGDFVGNN